MTDHKILSDQLYDENKVIDVAMLAGKILLESGAETYRVEDTMTRIATHYGLLNTHSFVTPTAIIFSLNDKSATRLLRIKDRTTDLEKISDTNEISRGITSGIVTLETAKFMLSELDQADLQFKMWLKVFAAGVASFFFLFMFKGSIMDSIPAFFIGAIGYYITEAVLNYTKVKFFAEFLSAIIITLLTHFSLLIGIGDSMDKIIIAAVMPLVPGVPITNAIRDLLAGQLLAGIARGTEAGLTAFAIGAGVGITLIII